MADYVIVGGGSAGCTMAARLSENPDVSVVLIEAGPRDTDPYIHMPVGFYKMTGGPLTWGYSTAPARHAADRVMVYPQARVLGGGSSINAQVYTRGAPQDFDRWAGEEGCAGWSYKEVLPYFRKAEDNERFAGPLHGSGGPLGVSDLISPSPLTKAFVKAAQEAGIPYNPDFNGERQEGCGIYQTTIRKGRRCSAAVGYLRPAMRRPNLMVKTGCLTTRIRVEAGRAVGVDYVEDGKPASIRAEREVVVAAGAIGSPKLLMLSGIGPAQHLRSHGIPVVLDLKGVGANLQDHMAVDIVYELTGAHSYDKYKQPHWKLWAGIEYHLFRSGPVTSNIAEGGAFWWADRSEPSPDLQFHFLPGAGVEKGVGTVPSGHGCTLNSYHVRPRSRGSVTLAGADPRVAPVIDPNSFAEDYDLERTVDSVMTSREIMAQPALRPFLRREHQPGDAVRSRADYGRFARAVARSAYHPVGTCKMGTDEWAVVDPRLRVHGIDALRVCDGSVMPSLVSANTNATAIMIGERAADFLKGNAA
jgi:choline dehydrogenase-like flavoprotein